MKDALKSLKLRENLVGSVLGVGVVVVSAVLLWNYFGSVNRPAQKGQITSGAATELSLEADKVAGVQLQGTYVVKQGDSLWSIAEKQYGTGYAWTKIYDVNKAAIGANPGLLTAGTKLNLPAGETAYPQHTIVRGETLWGVASTYCGSGQAWPSIAAANKIADPTKIEPGLVLKVACK